MSENLNEPQSRTEEILQNALGEEYDVTPQSRVEVLLEKVADSGGSGSTLPSFERLMEVEVHFNQSTGNCNGGSAFLANASLGSFIKSKHIIGFVAEKNTNDGLMTAMISCDRGDGVFVNPILHREATLDAHGASVLINSNESLNGQKVNIYAICI